MPGLENSGETDENANAAGEQCRVQRAAENYENANRSGLQKSVLAVDLKAILTARIMLVNEAVYQQCLERKHS